ncbi:MAG: toxin-antitoxin system YwqK family antitoxin [Bacteroidota bacterium]|nr:toxin-antitoxin system YwqK family antitoxin [Bacteroidota bacterium]
MKRILLFLFFIACKISTAQSFEINEQDTINLIDVNNLKQGHWIFWGKMKKLPGYSDSQKVEEGKYADNKKIGSWKKYFPSGNVQNEITYKNGRPNGYYINYYDNGKIEEEGTWVNNKPVGQFKRYHENGVISQEFNFNTKGDREGVQKYYYENGKVMIEGEWANGQESGVLKEYYENGDIRAEKNFANGTLDPATSKTYEPKKPLEKKEAPKPADNKPVVVAQKDELPNMGAFNGNGYGKLYNKNNLVVKDGVFQNYKLIDGKYFVYNNDGILQKIEIYKNGVYIGDGVISDK